MKLSYKIPKGWRKGKVGATIPKGAIYPDKETMTWKLVTTWIGFKFTKHDEIYIRRINKHKKGVRG